MTQQRDRIPATDPRYRLAVNNYRVEFGMDLDDVLLPSQWCVMDIDGEPMVMINADGARALAVMAPRPDAPQLVEDFITTMRGKGYRF
jgi:hypothetical protein